MEIDSTSPFKNKNIFMTTIHLALDWTPNVNHIGFFIAKDLGLYEQEGLALNIINPADDNYQVTPGKKLELNQADFAIAPFETVISLNNKTNKVDAVAVFAILQNDLSSIVTLSDTGINSPKELDGKIYASYKARYEDHIVKQMIVNAGGTGNIEISYPKKLGIWNTLLEGKATSTWIFDNWEGVEAESKNVALNTFKMGDFGIPYGYSPVVLAKKSKIHENKELYKRFIKATKEGFLYAQSNPSESVDILDKYAGTYQDIDLTRTLDVTAEHFGDAETCGKMQAKRVTSFLKWIVDNGLESEAILEQTLFTNTLID